MLQASRLNSTKGELIIAQNLGVSAHTLPYLGINTYQKTASDGWL